jgi:putative DNA primase/helicase
MIQSATSEKLNKDFHNKVRIIEPTEKHSIQLFDQIINELNNKPRLVDTDYARYFLLWSDHTLFYKIDDSRFYIYNGKYYKFDKEALLLKRKVLEFVTELVDYANKKNIEPRVMDKIYRMKSNNSIDNIVESIKIEARIEADQVDQEDHLFNCQNGILNLNTMELIKHNPEKKLTHIADVNYDPDAGEVEGEALKILKSFFLDDESILNFMFEFFGTCLHGNPAIRKFIYAFGSGKNGKSTFFNFFLRNIFGNYAASTNFQAFVGKRDNTRASSDLVPILGKRLVITNEAQTDRQLNTNLIKSITGGDNINARLNFKDDQSYKPHCKIIMFGNNQLEIADSSEGMRDRYVQIPFLARFTIDNERSQDEIWKILKANDSKILNSLIAGYKRFKENGFSEVSSIREASLEGFVSANNFVRFMKNALIQDNSSSIKTKDIYANYKIFVEIEELNPREKLTKSKLVNQLKSAGCKVFNDSYGVQHIKGYRLKEDDLFRELEN